MEMMKSLLGMSLGKCLASGEGLRVAYLSAGVSGELAVDMVRCANAHRRLSPPLAVLITDGVEDDSDESCVRLSPSSSIGYRVKDRLVVVAGQPPELASFTGAFTTVLPASYPIYADATLPLSELAATAVDLILEATEVSPDIVLDKSRIVELLEKCLSLTRDIHLEFGQTEKSWNAAWFNTVDQSLKTLADQLAKKIATQPSLLVGKTMEHFICPSFGLPQLDGNAVGTRTARNIYDAWLTYWSDEETVSTTTKHLSYYSGPDGDQHPLDGVRWHRYDEKVALSDNQMGAAVSLCSDNVEFLEAFASLTLHQFISPFSGSDTATKMHITGSHGELLDFDDADEDSVSFLMSSVILKESGEYALSSEEVRVHLPFATLANEQLVTASDATLQVPGANAQWQGEIVADGNGGAYMVGRFQIGLGKSNPHYRLQIKRITLRVNQNDSLQSVIDPTQSVQICILPAGAPAVVYGIKTKKGLRKLTHLGPDEFDAEAEEFRVDLSYSVELSDPNLDYMVLAVNVKESASLNGADLPPVKNRSNLHTVTLRPSGSDEFVLDGTSFDLSVPDASSQFESPLEAAIYKQRVSSMLPSADAFASALGTYELALSELVCGGQWEPSLGHFAMPSDRDVDFAKADFSPLTGQIAHPSVAAMAKPPKYVLPTELVGSVELANFLASFASLDVSRQLQYSKQADSYHLPSKVSWRHLVQNDNLKKLEAYLVTYRFLVEKARAIGSPYGIFWASYPFSVSVWDTTAAFDCSAVFLSPLHPLRLAWLAGVENVLWGAKMAPTLAGTVEGWNFPVCGPRTTKLGRMIAVPLDAGPGSLFLGWSMLVPASLDTPSPLAAPAKIGNLPAPASAVSGLNGTSTKSALRSYMGLNPHLTTLTVDLAAATGTSRVPEIDLAVLSSADKWMRNENLGLIGGVRVWDSVHRNDEPSVEKILEHRRKNENTPLVWRRYEPDALNPIQCNVRVLQDSGSVVSFGTGTGNNRGAVGNFPLRRFEVHTAPGAGSISSDMRPALRNNDGWLEYAMALSAVENSAEVPEIQSHLASTFEAANAADWTVSGEAFVNPSAMAQLVDQTSEGNQMLWEWRPPFLDQLAESSALQRRPYISITRVPPGFRDGVAQLVGKALGAPPDVAEGTRVLSKLGSRGVGLSTLFSMGGTHASGALGFYLGFKLMESLTPRAANIFVLPMDASDSFMRAMAGLSTTANSTQRADLLVLALDDTRITLVPIEIKCFGLGAEKLTATLPKPGSSALSKPGTQLDSSVQLLDTLSEKWSQLADVNDPSDRLLWTNGLMSLLDAAMRLHPIDDTQEPEVHSRLHSMANGALRVCAGKPLLAYFQHGAATEDGSQFEAFIPDTGSTNPNVTSAGVFVANTGAAYTALNGSSSNMGDAWQRLIDWATEDDPEADSTAAVQDLQGPFGAGGAGGQVRDLESGDGRTDRQESGSPAPEAKLDFGSEEDTTVAIQDSQSPIDAGGADGQPVSDLESSDGSTDQQESDWPEPAAELDFGSEEDTWVEELAQSGPVPNPPRSDDDWEGTTLGTGTAPDQSGEPPLDEPTLTDGIRFEVGTFKDTLGATPAEFWPSNTKLNQMNIGVVGDLGTGKTQLLQTLVYQMRREAKTRQSVPLSFLIFDYKEDFQRQDFLEAVGGKVLKPFNIPLNVLALPGPYTPHAAYKRAAEFFDIVSKIFPGMGPVQRGRVVRVIVDLFAETGGIAPTLRQVLDGYEAAADKADAMTAVLSDFVYSGIFSEDIDQLKSFEDLINDAVLVVALKDLGSNQRTKNALVVLFLNIYYDYMLSSSKPPFKKGLSANQVRQLNSFLLVDEATNIMTYDFPVLEQILLQGREFGFGAILSSQYLKHFTAANTNYGEPLLTWFIHKVPQISLKELQILGLHDLPATTPARIAGQDLHDAFYVSLDTPGRFIRGLPFYKLISGHDNDSAR